LNSPGHKPRCLISPSHKSRRSLAPRLARPSFPSSIRCFVGCLFQGVIRRRRINTSRRMASVLSCEYYHTLLLMRQRLVTASVARRRTWIPKSTLLYEHGATTPLTCLRLAFCLNNTFNFLLHTTRAILCPPSIPFWLVLSDLLVPFSLPWPLFAEGRKVLDVGEDISYIWRAYTITWLKAW
jgi:hypothetical protein